MVLELVTQSIPTVLNIPTYLTYGSIMATP